jgi:hypothetical protein
MLPTCFRIMGGKCMSTEGIALRILNLGIRWSSMVSFTFLPFTPRGRAQFYPSDKRLGLDAVKKKIVSVPLRK